MRENRGHWMIENNITISSNPSEEGCACVRLILDMYWNWSNEKGYGSFVDLNKGFISIVCPKNLEKESKIHRISRISPFDDKKRRYTTFVTVDVNGKFRKEIPEYSKGIGIGNVRSYIFYSYQLVKDYDLDVETRDIESVMAGNIEMFLK